MFWRIIAGLGALTFIVGGLDVLSSDCASVDFGGTARSSTYACAPAGAGEMNGTLAGIGMIVLGVLLLAFATSPFWRTLIQDRRSGRATFISNNPLPRPSTSIDIETPVHAAQVEQARPNRATSWEPASAWLGTDRASHAALVPSCDGILASIADHPNRDAIEGAVALFVTQVRPVRHFNLWFAASSEHAFCVLYDGFAYVCSPSSVYRVDRDKAAVVEEIGPIGNISTLLIDGIRLENPTPQLQAKNLATLLRATTRSALSWSFAPSPLPTPQMDVPEVQATMSPHDGWDHAPAGIQTAGDFASAPGDVQTHSSSLGIANSLAELEVLKQRGLVANAEYDEKRAAILRRL